MARIRTIKPDFFTHSGLGDLSPWGRLLFIGLWTQADRAGRLKDDPKRLKVVLLPYDEVDTDKLLQELHDHPESFITRYEVGGEKFIQINNFLSHQRPNVKELESTIPACVKTDKSSAGTFRHVQKYSGTCKNIPAPIQHARKGREGKGKERKEMPAGASTAQLSDEDFLQKLKDNPAYRHVDIEVELGKMDAWLLTPRGRGRKKTRSFIVNWLNKIDRPVDTGPPPEEKPSKPPCRRCHKTDYINSTKLNGVICSPCYAEECKEQVAHKTGNNMGGINYVQNSTTPLH